MISIAEMMSPDRINLELKEKKKKKVIQELAEMLGETGIVNDSSSLTKQILKRESMASTGIGHGIAIPHVLTDLVDQTLITFGRSSRGIAFDSVDNRPVYLFFLIVGPSSCSGEHLKLLSKLSRLLTDESFREKLLGAEKPEEVIELFRRGE
ncbi:MAG: PTS sugar transporter subunit IIA [Spirochaetia bacterium]